ncbi:protein kinase domain-containing protein [Bacillus horti]|uniref:Serine/threonine protein kinase/DNA-binding CsgD family transcriptional regulator n=1 Tax=Caldalkalibacillus horti TaxID=77523 RepID=A0ABT9W0S5_9BACI|nr:LuxR C-terminal-related transcriptional regulator [Bacillus horti]MDQ0166831.1 serine/threonine protein kinase/DNA-binding CsgD family transcriptional regulator [Bacillus horti]
MIEIPGYSITEIIYHDPYIMIGYAVSEKTSKIMLLKVVINGNRTMIENAKLIHEYNFLSEFEMEGILKPTSYITFKNKIILEYEPIHGATLRGYFANGSVSVAMYASILMRVVQRLHQLHEHNILHLNIRPDTLLIQPNTNQIFLTGFGYAVQIKQQMFQDKGQLEGNPIYMSPEQTGRLNQTVDITADIYSLGMTFYELFTQKLPFQETGSLDWAHSHLAQTPIPPHAVNQKIPQKLSEIVMRMLAKDPDARYANLLALQTDIALYLSEETEDFLEAPECNKAPSPSSVPMSSNTSAQQEAEISQAFEPTQPPLTFFEQIVGYPQVLDLAATVLASEIYNENTQGKRMAERFVQLLIKSAGAERGLLITIHNSGLYVEIEARLERDRIVSSSDRLSLENCPGVRQELVHTAWRTKELIQAKEQRSIHSQATRASGRENGSALCLPVLVHEQIMGFLYIENTLTNNGFAPERFHVLRSLTLQALFALNAHSSPVGGEYHNYLNELGEQQPTNKLSLTKREEEVLQLMSKGLSNGEIAEALTITKETVKTHVKHIFDKLKVDRRMKAVAVAKTLGMLEE